MSNLSFHGRLALQQRVLPSYRAPFFDLLAGACTGGLSVFAGQPQSDENIPSINRLNVASYVPTTNHHFFKMGSPFYRCYQSGILHWLEDWQPDALVVEANPRYLSTPGAIRWMQARGKPVIGWGLGASPIRGWLASPRLRSRRRFLHSLDGVIAYSQRGAEEYRQLGIPSERVFVATNAVAPRPTEPPPMRSADFSGQPVVLFVGRLQERKRVDHLLRACAALPEVLQPDLQIVGDGPARTSFESLAKEIYPDARFLGAHFGDQLAADFRAADLFVLPGTGGLAVQQAMSYGLPAIVAQGDGTQDDLVRPGNGWLIPPDDLPALSNTLREALSNPARLREMGTESFRIVSEEINLDKMVEVFIRALNYLAK